MILSWEILYGAFVFLIFLSIIGLAAFFFFKLQKRHLQKKKELLLHHLTKLLNGLRSRQLPDFVAGSPKIALRLLLELNQSVTFSKKIQQQIVTLICSTGLEAFYIRRLENSNLRKRMDAALHLSVLPTDNTYIALEKALQREQNQDVKLHLCSALVDVEHIGAIGSIIDSLIDAPQWYQTKVNMLLVEFGPALGSYIPELLQRNQAAIDNLLVDISPFFPSEIMCQYLLSKTAPGGSPDIRYRSVRSLGQLYPRELATPLFLDNSNPVIRNIAIDAMAQIPTETVAALLIPYLSDLRYHEHTAASLSNMLQKNPRLLEFFLQRFSTAKPKLRDSLAGVLSLRIDYLFLRLLGRQKELTIPVITEIIRRGQTSGLIAFLNRNSNRELENEILALLRPLINESEKLREELRQYLLPALLEKLELKPYHAPLPVRQPEIERDKQLRLLLLLVIAFFSVPFLYTLLHWQESAGWTAYTHLTQFVLDYNYFLAFYSLSLSTTYLILLTCSWLGMDQQTKLWRLKKPTFLFRNRVLPSISIIAPAYQEETTIVNSAHSLLNLHYPNYELIIVNDGSTDQTLQQLISAFELEKVDAVVPPRLKTRPLRGIYRNKHIPRLVVVDKDNGGKADALNVGINVSKKEFFCGIDADSLLEKDALLKLAAMILDAKTEAVAFGGNVFPINGCTVDKGFIAQVALPANFWAQLQTIEYFRAFMTGRLGWAYLRSLLIISGAFGLFRKERIIEIGGYLTSSERYKKDTVGEDMELVVRLRRHMAEQNLPCSVYYSYNANCWTEVPESYSILHQQRDRWQRGLIDICYLHRVMLLNPRYGSTGLVAMPYFFFFEIFGPFLEIQGYFMIVLAYFLGLLNPALAFFLFLTTIMFGIVVSIFSLAIAAKESTTFSVSDNFRLILFAILENFGPRQLISFWRVSGYWSSLKQTTAWGKMTRRGFTPQNLPNKEKA